jgi:cell division protein ZapA
MMNETIKIKLTVADRVYPLTISPEQEASLRASARKIEAMTKQLEQNYAVSDKQDVLAMCALQYAAQLENQLENNKGEDIGSIKTNELIELIDLHLSNY